MAYTPINWQSGDTITAVKLNKMDNGWSVSTSLQTCFNDSVTTTDANNRMVELQNLTYDFQTAAEIKVTLDNVVYNLTGFDDDGYWTWGAPYGDFSQYSFSICIVENGTATFVSQTAGTYNLKIEVNVTSAETSSDFQAAVQSVFGAVRMPLQLVPNETTYDEAQTAANAGRLLYFYAEENSIQKCFFVSVLSATCQIIPESAEIAAKFPRDGGAFYIETL